MTDRWDTQGWNDSYVEGNIPWHSDEPHREIVRWVEEGDWKPGKILDIGCGRGSNLIWLASHGFEGWGVDLSKEAIGQAEARKAAGVRFFTMNALHVDSLGQKFDYVLDMGCYHLHEFTPELRPKYAQVVRSVLKPSGEYGLLCFSPKEPAEWGGPRRVAREELDEIFSPHFELKSIHEANWMATDESEGPWCWVSRWAPLLP